MLFSCKSKKTGYVNHEKWRGINKYETRPLNGSPKEIHEKTFPVLKDTSLDVTESYNGSYFTSQYKFDRQGNLTLLRYYFIDSSIYSEWIFSYDENGVQYEYFSKKKKGQLLKLKGRMVSRKTGPSKYKEVYYENDAVSRIEFVSTAAAGDFVKRERYKADKLLLRSKRYYKKGLIYRAETFRKDDLTISQSYYSDMGVQDSIVRRSNDEVVGKTVFINNERGDPVFLEETNRGEVVSRLWMKYLYDEKGNWYRKLEKIESFIPSKYQLKKEGEKFPGYTLVIRAIKY